MKKIAGLILVSLLVSQCVFGLSYDTSEWTMVFERANGTIIREIPLTDINDYSLKTFDGGTGSHGGEVMTDGIIHALVRLKNGKTELVELHRSHRIYFKLAGSSPAGKPDKVTGTPPRVTRSSSTEKQVRANPVGSWRNNNLSTWTITKTSDGGYFAQESGLGNVQGPGRFTPSGTFRIDFGSGFYEVRFASDNRTATGYCNTPGNTCTWVKIDQ